MNESMLSYEGFSFAYPGSTACVGPVDWTIPQGAFVLLTGATGSGKTTLLRCAKPETAPTGSRTGSIALRPGAAVGYVAQSPENQLVCDTVWHQMAFGLENLGLPQQEMHRRVAEVAHFFGIEPWFRRKVGELSGGQQQMLNLASVLVMQPRLLLLDEPTAQLDPVAEKNFCHALFRLNRQLGMTIVVATHAPEALADYATAAVELRDGAIVPAGLPVAASWVPGETAAQGGEAVLGGEASALGGETAVQGDGTAPGRDPSAPGGEKTSWDGGASAGRPAITLADVHARYGRDAEPVLMGLDLTVSAGTVHAVVGGNGCGKSTLLKVIAGTMKPVRGRCVNGLAARQALLPQNPKALFVEDSVDEELMEWSAACGYSRQDAQDIAARFGLDGHLGNHPYDLSGGQQQLLGLAKLLLTDPDLLLLDEPAKGLDAPSRLLLADALRDLASRGRTVLMVTHDLAFAACVADQVTMLFDGQATATQPPARFFAGNLFYRPVADAFTRLWEARNEDARG